MFAKAFGIIAALSAAAAALPSAHGHSHAHSHHQLAARQDAGAITSDGVHIANNMDKPVYIWSVSEESSEMYTVNSGESYYETWRVNPNGGGISIKLSLSPEQTDILQYEYTLEGATLWWDLSCVNMSENPGFISTGFAVSSTDSTCPTATCAPGDVACAAAYLLPNDNWATHACQSADVLTLNLGPVPA